MTRMRLLIVLAAAIAAAAQQRVTEGELKVVWEGGAREGPSWDPAGYLYFSGGGKV